MLEVGQRVHSSYFAILCYINARIPRDGALLDWYLYGLPPPLPPDGDPGRGENNTSPLRARPPRRSQGAPLGETTDGPARLLSPQAVWFDSEPPEATAITVTRPPRETSQVRGQWRAGAPPAVCPPPISSCSHAAAQSRFPQGMWSRDGDRRDTPASLRFSPGADASAALRHEPRLERL